MGKVFKKLLDPLGLFSKPEAPDVTKQVVNAPSSAVDTREDDEDEIELGSERANSKGKRNKGRRQLMSRQGSDNSSNAATNNTSSGLQI